MATKTYDGLLKKYTGAYSQKKEKEYRFKTQIITMPPDMDALWASNPIAGNKLMIIWGKKKTRRKKR